jgi:hypothetical protein
MEDPSAYPYPQFAQPAYGALPPQQFWSQAQLQAAGRVRDDRQYTPEDQRRELEMRYALGGQYAEASYGE